MKSIFFTVLTALVLVLSSCGEDTPTKVNKCKDVTCSGHGTCVVENDTATCECDNGYVVSGFECITESKCANVTCDDWKTCNETNGSCELKTDRCDTTANCSEGKECNTTTHTCVNPVNPCEEIACSSHGACVVENNNPTCDCDEGYHAENLECVIDVVDLCETVNCDEWKSCNPINGQCVLKTGRCDVSGDCLETEECNTTTHTCVNPVNPCEGVACSGHGACIVENNNPVCECDTGYHPDNLTCVDTNECLSALISCEEGYECENIEGGFDCIDINECIANTDNCSENADCANTNGNFTCTCKAGYTGNGVTCSLASLCGNDVLNGDEECDGSEFLFDCDDNLAGSTGVVTCNDDCTTNFSACVAPICGDNIINQESEDCDGMDIIFTCDDHQAGLTGTVSCNLDCSLNFSQCSVVNNCGNDVLNGDEECDGSEFLFACEDNQAGSTGTVTCNDDCTTNFSACVAPICGDNVVNQGSEECDGMDMLFTCADNDINSQGTPVCGLDCITDFSSCTCKTNYHLHNSVCTPDFLEIPIGWCSTQWPLSIIIGTGVDTELIYGQVWSDGVTTPAGEPVGITAQLCYTTDSTLTTGVVCTEALWDQQIGDNDQFAVWLNFNASGTYYYYYQFSGSNGVIWYPCDIIDTTLNFDNGTAYHTGTDPFNKHTGVATVTGSSNPQFLNNNFSVWTSDTVVSKWGGTNALVTVSKDVVGDNQPSVHLNSPATTTSNMYGLESDFIVANANKPKTITFSMKGSGKMSINVWCDTNNDNLSTGEQKFYNLDTTGSDIKFETSGSNAYNSFAAADWTTYSVEIGTTLDTLWTEGKNCKIQFKVGKTYLFDASIDDVLINY